MKKLNKDTWKNLGVQISILLGFVVLSLGVFYPLLQNKKLLQSDSMQYLGMSRQLQESRKATGEELYWVDNAYGGMPTYQLGAKYPADILTPIHKVFRLLPHPAFLLFLYFLGAYVFLCALALPKRYAVLGALAYGLSTYLLIILQVGHNTKAQALGYLPFVFAGMHYVFTKKHLLGFLLSTLAMALQIRANHYQMTYYMLLLMGVYFGVMLLKEYKQKSFWKSTVLFGVSGVLALGLNATSLLATAEYAAFSTRGTQELSVEANGNPKEPSKGLAYDYITQFSYGIFESFNLIIPRIQGGATTEKLDDSSVIYNYLVQRGVSRGQANDFVKNVPTYWGDQPFVEAPAYVGIVVVFLAVLGLLYRRDALKNALLLGVVMSLLLSWGKNLDFLTALMVDYFPFYNKFRAVSSIQVILEFCFPVLAALGLYEMLNSSYKQALMNSLKKSSLGFLLLILGLFLLQGALSFRGANDAYYTQVFGQDIMAKILEERQTLYTHDLLRALLFFVLTAGALWLSLKEKLKSHHAFLAIGLFLVVDLLQVSNRYLDRDLFLPPSRVKTPFTEQASDKAIAADTTYYRVYDAKEGIQGARASYFHNSIGGYHGAKPRRLEELMTLFEAKRHQEILNILNIKYVQYADEKEQLQVLENPDNLGGAWFVAQAAIHPTVDATYLAMAETDFANAAVLWQEDIGEIPTAFLGSSSATIDLVSHAPGRVEYQTNNAEEGLAVFSEMYYPKGWTLTVDGAPHPFFRANYLLRAAILPAGKHRLVFQFDPPVVRLGTTIQWASIGSMFLLVLGFMAYRKQFDALWES